MVVFHIENDMIKMCKGDNGSIAFSLSNYDLTEDDTIEMYINGLDYKKLASYDRGYAFFNFTDVETNRFEVGEYTYDFYVTTKNIARVCLLHRRKFIVEV